MGSELEGAMWGSGVHVPSTRFMPHNRECNILLLPISEEENFKKGEMKKGRRRRRRKKGRKRRKRRKRRRKRRKQGSDKVLMKTP